MGGPPPICIHNRHRYHCVECKGAGICEHSKRKIRCKECGGKSICSHGCEKGNCVPCGGASICEHGKRRRRCVECFGAAICEHKKNRQNCLECGGNIFCIHNKKKSRCKICDGSELCVAPLCETRGIKKYGGYCLPCCIHYCPEIQVSRNYKTKENDVVQRVLEKYPDFNWVADKKIQNGCSKRRPDLLLDLGSHVIILEVDENKHTTYDCSCQNKRLMEISQDIGHRPVVFIRFNPDAYVNQEGTKITSCWRINGYGVLDISKSKRDEWHSRINMLIQQLEYWINNIPHKTVEIVELFY
jgi:hypothetical protein